MEGFVVSIANPIIIRKRRMTESLEKTKLITKLIKIISEKEKQLSAYRHRNKPQPQPNHNHNISESKIEQECISNALELKILSNRVSEMEARMSQLTEQLIQESELAAASQTKVKQMEEKEQRYVIQINDLREELKKEKQSSMEWQERARVAIGEKKELEQKMESFKVELEYQRILERKIQVITKDLLEQGRVQQKIEQNIDAIYIKFCRNHPNPLSNFTTKAENIFSKLASIQKALQQQAFLSQHEHVLNDTIEGMSIIMESIEQRLQVAACLTDRGNHPSHEKRCNAWRQPLTCDDSQRTTVVKPPKNEKENLNHNQ